MSRRDPITPADPDEDLALVDAAREGDADALGELFVRHAGAVRRLLLSVIGPTEELDDLTQDVFVRVHRAIGGFRGEARFATWLHRVTVHTALSHLRARGRERSIAAPPEEIDARPGRGEPTAHERAVGRELVRRLYGLLAKMTPLRQVAFTLFEIEGRPIAEVARLTGVPAPVAKSRIWFARKDLRRRAAGDPYLAQLLEELER